MDGRKDTRVHMYKKLIRPAKRESRLTGGVVKHCSIITLRDTLSKKGSSSTALVEPPVQY